MQKNNHIYDIITKFLLGTINEHESIELDEWLAESSSNRQLFDSFMLRNEVSHIFDINSVHRDAELMFADDAAMPDAGRKAANEAHKTIILSSRWMKVGIAAVAVMLVAMFWWHKYTEVVAPQLSDEYIAAMSMSQKAGRSDADIVVSNMMTKNNAHVASVSNVKDESFFDEIVCSLTKDNDVEPRNLQAQVVTHHDKEFWLTLPDGTRVHLNYGCRLTYPLQFTGDMREVTLDGEAYFSVAKDKRHPFVVHTQYGDVKEYGTEFVINTRYTSDAVGSVDAVKGSGTSVVLIEGSISVTPNRGKEIMMKPSDMALLDASLSNPVIQKVDTTPFVAWNTGIFAFDNCPLEQLLDVLSRWYSVKVAFVGDASHRLSTFTGELDRYNDVSSEVRAISNVTGLKIKMADNTIIVE